MSEVKKRKVPGANLKAKIGLEAIRGAKTLNEIAQEYPVGRSNSPTFGHFKFPHPVTA